MSAKPLRMEVRIQPTGTKELPNSLDIYWGFKKFMDEYFKSRFPKLQGVECHVELIMVQSHTGKQRMPKKFEETYEEDLLS